MNCKLACKAVYSSIASKVLILDPVSNPIKIKPNQKRSKQNKKQHITTTKPNQTEHRGVGSLPVMGITCMMTS